MTIAANGRDGIERVRKGEFDIVLMDLQMPIVDGYQATAELRKQGYKIPIVALTAHALKEEKLACLAHGFDDYLTKPIDLKMAIETIRRNLKKE